MGRRAKHIGLILLGLAWSVSLAASLGAIHRYTSTSGSSGPTPPSWPAQSALPHDTTRPTVLVFVHPECVCTPTTIDAIRRVTQPASVRTMVIDSGPAAARSAGQRSQHWAQRIGATRVVDATGIEASAFGAQVSGHVVVASASGRILFSGGITPGRGHAGPCEGLSAFQEALARATDAPLDGASIEIPTPPVFGCPIFNEEPCRPESPTCNQEHAGPMHDAHRAGHIVTNSSDGHTERTTWNP
jgi:hypothetical protein